MLNVETEFKKDAYGNLYGCHEPVNVVTYGDYGYAAIVDEEGVTIVYPE